MTAEDVKTPDEITAEQKELAQAHYNAGKQAFERGRYRESVQLLEKAVSLIERNTRIGGEMQMWLVTAYEAAGQRDTATALCEQLVRHPDSKVRKQGRRVLAILQAPRLRTRPEWLTQIPDLSKLEDSDQDAQKAYTPTTPKRPPKPRPPKPEPDLAPIDLSQVNTRDNRFIWVAGVAIALILSSLIWLSQ